MSRILFLALIASAAVATTMSARLGLVDPPVNLQAVTPGIPQVGHTNISGRMIAGSLSASDPGSAAQVIVGNATATTGANYAGLFRTDSSNGTGIRGVASAATGAANGGTFQSAGPNGAGVRGFATAASGVNCGVYGKAVSSTGFGVFSEGNMSATGIISGNGGGLTSLNASNLATGVVPIGVLPNNIAFTNANVTFSGAVNWFTGHLSVGGILSGNGSGVTNVNANLLDGLDSTAFLQAIPNPLSLSGNSTSHTIRGMNSSIETLASGVSGVANGAEGSTVGVYGQNWGTGGMGVFGLAIADTGNTIGVIGQSNSSSGVGLYGIVRSSTGPSIGGRFESNSPTGFAGYFEGSGGDAVFIKNLAAGRGMSVVSTSDTALWAVTTSGFTGVDGRNASTTGYGMYGLASSNSGVNYGVVGHSASPSGYGVFSIGTLGASGTKPFRIDHPLDPENRYLLHYATESPEPLNVYRGTVTTDAKGEAWVSLPDYYSEINRDPTYQLTVVEDADNDQFVQAKIAVKIQANRFKIRTSVPRVEVCWRVEAVRNDRWVRQNGAPVEVEKEGRERGTYQHPELYGLGPERGMNYEGLRQKARAPVAAQPPR